MHLSAASTPPPTPPTPRTPFFSFCFIIGFTYFSLSRVLKLHLRGRGRGRGLIDSSVSRIWFYSTQEFAAFL